MILCDVQNIAVCYLNLALAGSLKMLCIWNKLSVSFLRKQQTYFKQCNELEAQETTILPLLLCIVCSVTVDNAFNLQRELENLLKYFVPGRWGSVMLHEALSALELIAMIIFFQDELLTFVELL